MLKPAMNLLSYVILLSVIAAPAWGVSIPVANPSFEIPYIDPETNPYGAISLIPLWTELDNDTEGSTNTGIFRNTPPEYEDHIVNSDANQIAFLGSELGNAILQDLSVVYQVDKSYKLTVGICVSNFAAPPDPNGLELVFYYKEPGDPNVLEILTAETLPPSTFTSTFLEDNSLYLPTVQAEDAWAGKPIGIAIRATGFAGGFWDLDNVRVTEYPLVPDFTDDSFVNLADFAKMAFDWYSCDDPLTDVTGEGCVDEDDLLILISDWLENV